MAYKKPAVPWWAADEPQEVKVKERLNDDGAPIYLGDGRDADQPGGNGTGLWYCGRQLGEKAFGGDSDGQCGPHGGPQCPSCRRYQAYQDSRYDVGSDLQNLFNLPDGNTRLLQERVKGKVQQILAGRDLSDKTITIGALRKTLEERLGLPTDALQSTKRLRKWVCQVLEHEVLKKTQRSSKCERICRALADMETYPDNCRRMLIEALPSAMAHPEGLTSGGDAPHPHQVRILETVQIALKESLDHVQKNSASIATEIASESAKLSQREKARDDASENTAEAKVEFEEKEKSLNAAEEACEKAKADFDNAETTRRDAHSSRVSILSEQRRFAAVHAMFVDILEDRDFVEASSSASGSVGDEGQTVEAAGRREDAMKVDDTLVAELAAAEAAAEVKRQELSDCQRHWISEDQEHKKAEAKLEEPRKIMANLERQRKQVADLLASVDQKGSSETLEMFLQAAGADPVLIAALPSMLAKEPSERVGFDLFLLSSVRELLTEKVSSEEAKIQAETTLQAGAHAEATGAFAVLYLARERLDEAEAGFKEAERAMEVARERLSEANKPLQQKEEDRKRAREMPREKKIEEVHVGLKASGAEASLVTAALNALTQTKKLRSKFEEMSAKAVATFCEEYALKLEQDLVRNATEQEDGPVVEAKLQHDELIASAATKMLALSKARQALSKSDTLLRTARMKAEQQAEGVAKWQAQSDELLANSQELTEVVDIVDQLTRCTDPPSPGPVTQDPDLELLPDSTEADTPQGETAEPGDAEAAEFDAGEMLGNELISAFDAVQDQEAATTRTASAVEFGQQISCKAPSGKVRACTVIEATETQLKIHYDGFVARFDEWLPRDSDRILHNTECTEPPCKKPRLGETEVEEKAVDQTGMDAAMAPAGETASCELRLRTPAKEPEPMEDGSVDIQAVMSSGGA